jgi:hypothetical protein
MAWARSERAVKAGSTRAMVATHLLADLILRRLELGVLEGALLDLLEAGLDLRGVLRRGLLGGGRLVLCGDVRRKRERGGGEHAGDGGASGHSSLLTGFFASPAGDEARGPGGPGAGVYPAGKPSVPRRCLIRWQRTLSGGWVRQLQPL